MYVFVSLMLMGSDCEEKRLDDLNDGMMQTAGVDLRTDQIPWVVVGQSFEHPESFDRAVERMNTYYDPCVVLDAMIDEVAFLELEMASDDERLGTIIVSEGFVGTPEWDDELGFIDDGGIADLRWDDGGIIIFADIVVNIDHAYDATWVEDTLVHEFGHVMGLAHDGDSLDLGSCMSSPPPVGCRILTSDVELSSNRLDC